jgi:hypothetical protein
MQSAPPAQHTLSGHVGQVHSLAVGNNMLFSGAQVRRHFNCYFKSETGDSEGAFLTAVFPC